MRHLALLGTLAVASFAIRARAEEAPSLPPPPAPPPQDASAVSASPVLARQAAAIDELRASLEVDRQAREHPFLRLFGYVQLVWVVLHQISQHEISGAT